LIISHKKNGRLNSCLKKSIYSNARCRVARILFNYLIKKPTERAGFPPINELRRLSTEPVLTCGYRLRF